MEDTGRMAGGLEADQSISFQAMEEQLKQLSDIVQADPPWTRWSGLRRERRRQGNKCRLGVRFAEATGHA